MDTTPHNNEDTDDAREDTDDAVSRLTVDEYNAVGDTLHDALQDDPDNALAQAGARLWQEIAWLVTEREHVARQASSLSLVLIALHDHAFKIGDLGLVAAINEGLRSQGLLEGSLPTPNPELHLPNRAQRRAAEKQARKKGA